MGPLPKSKSGNQFMLTVMCVSTRFPEAIPLSKITAAVVSKELIKFFTTSGVPRVVQTVSTKKTFNVCRTRTCCAHIMICGKVFFMDMSIQYSDQTRVWFYGQGCYGP